MNAQAKRGRDAAAEADAVALKNAIAAAAAATDAEAQRVKVGNDLLVCIVARTRPAPPTGSTISCATRTSLAMSAGLLRSGSALAT